MGALIEAFRALADHPLTKWADLRNRVPAAEEIEKIVRSTNTYEWKTVGAAHYLYRVEIGKRRYTSVPVATILPESSRSFSVSFSSGGRSVSVTADTLAKAKKKIISELILPKS